MNAANERLQRWEREQSRQWVEQWQGQWDHIAWLSLLGELRRSGWVDLDTEAVGRILERRKREFFNLHHWRETGEAWRWVESRQGRWEHHDWMTLLAGLQCWLGPIDADSLATLLEGYARIYHDWQRWVATSEATRWVQAHDGHWNHSDWLELLESLKSTEFADLPAALVGLTVEEQKRVFWNLRHWVESREPYRWVEAHRGRWDDQQWRGLLAWLERSPFWPMPLPAVGEILEQARMRYENLRRWQRSGAALLWVTVRRGKWDQTDLRDLMTQMEKSETGAVDLLALTEVLDDLREQYDSLERWLARRSMVQERLVLSEEDVTPPGTRLAA